MDDAPPREPTEEQRATTPQGRGRIGAVIDRAQAGVHDLRERNALLDTGFRIYERDKDAGGTLMGSALAVRLFLFFLPLMLLAVGLIGIVTQQFDATSPAPTYGISGSMAEHIEYSLNQQGTAPWFAAGIGLVGLATTGRSLSRALTLSSALSWQMGGKQKTAIRAIGVVVGLVVGLALTAAVVNRIRSSSGLAVASMSLAAVMPLYLVLWSLVYLALPRKTTDPGAALPGGLIVALVLTGLQSFTQLFLPNQIANSSSLYGSIGVLVAFLGWFFILGRVIAFSFAVNAVVYERLGSVSHLVFSLPGLRALPRRFPPVGRFFELDHVIEDE